MRIVRMPSSSHDATTASSSSTASPPHRQQSAWLPSAVAWLPPSADINRAKLWWFNIPLGTRVVLGLCVVATLLCDTRRACLGLHNAISPASLHAPAVAPPSSWTLFGAAWSFAAATWVHHGILHWLMNSLAMLAIGPDMELAIGTSSFGWLIVLLVGLVNALFLVCEYVFAHALGWVSPTCTVGLSGVLFALMTFEAWDGMQRHGQSQSQPRETLLFGIVAVRTKLAPFLLLVAMAMLFPGSSFVMHAAGVAIGLVVASVSHTSVFLHATGVCGRDSFCSRCRHFEDAPVVAGRRVDVASVDAQQSSSTGGSNSGGAFVLPVAAAPKGFEAFQTPGRRLGDGRASGPATAPSAPSQSTMQAEDVV